MCFPICFPYYPIRIHFPMFLELYGFLFHAKYVSNPYFWNIFVFPKFSRAMEIHFSHVLGIVCISDSREICKKHLTLECSVFSYFSRTIGNHFPHVLGTILLMWRLIIFFFISNPISTQTFMWNSSLRNVTYFVAGSNPISAFQIPLS